MALRTDGDLYAELGLDLTATDDEIAVAFRALAKELHPDARPGDVVAAERFKRVSAAYRVLSDRDRRATYDANRRLQAAQAAAAVAAEAAGQPARPGWRLTRRGARWMVVGGIACVVLGIAATAWVVSLQQRDADLRNHGRPATATVVEVGGERLLQFTVDGRTVQAKEPVQTGEGEPAVGDHVSIHYDAKDPTRVSADVDHTARDITLWIVAVKLLVGGLILVLFGARRLRRPDTDAVR